MILGWNGVDPIEGDKQIMYRVDGLNANTLNKPKYS
jgi:hypothetical protein